MVPLDVRILRIYDESAGTALSSSFPATLRDLCWSLSVLSTRSVSF